CTQEQRALEPWNRQVDDGEQVHVVAADRPVEQALAVWEGGRIGQRSGKVRADVGQRLDRRFQVLQVGHQIGRRIVGQLCGRVTEGAQLLQRGGDPRSLLDQDVQSRWYLTDHALDHVVLTGECACEPVQI